MLVELPAIFRYSSKTVNYIVSKGISPNRLLGKGYGESQLTNGCVNGVKCSEVEHQITRRTEFVIVNLEVIYYTN